MDAGYILATVLFCLIFLPPTLAFAIPAWNKSDARMRQKGYRKIYCKSAKLHEADRSARHAPSNEAFYTWAIVDPIGDLVAYRYPDDMRGLITLREDGTGYYFGDIEWAYAP